MPTTPPNSPSRGKHAWKGSTGRRDNSRRRKEFQNAHGPGPTQLAAIQKDADDLAQHVVQRSVDAQTACGAAVAKKTRRRRPRKPVYKPDFQACATAAELHVVAQGTRSGPDAAIVVPLVREVWSCLHDVCAQVGPAIAKANAEAKAAARAVARVDQAAAKAERAVAKAKAVAERKVARERKAEDGRAKRDERAKKQADKLAAAEATTVAKLATVRTPL